MTLEEENKALREEIERHKLAYADMLDACVAVERKLNKECADLRVKLAASTCDALQKALAKIDERQDEIDRLRNKLYAMGLGDDNWVVESFSYDVEWSEEWGWDSKNCGDNLDKAKKIFAGKVAEGKAAMLTNNLEIYLEDDEDEDA